MEVISPHFPAQGALGLGSREGAWRCGVVLTHLPGQSKPMGQTADISAWNPPHPTRPLDMMARSSRLCRRLFFPIREHPAPMSSRPCTGLNQSPSLHPRRHTLVPAPSSLTWPVIMDPSHSLASPNSLQVSICSQKPEKSL